MTRTIAINCAGPHVAPVHLYDALVPDDAPDPNPHNVLCVDCGQVYAIGLADQDTITDPTTGKPAPNPDKLTPGQIPAAAQVERIKQRPQPSWTPPPHNYKTPPGSTS